MSALNHRERGSPARKPTTHDGSEQRPGLREKLRPHIPSVGRSSSSKMDLGRSMRPSLRKRLMMTALGTALGSCVTWTAWAWVEEAATMHLLSSTRTAFEFLAPYERPLRGAQSMRLSLNGVSLRVHSLGLDATEEQVDAAFAAFERNCRAPTRGGASAVVPPPLLLGQNERERFGYCIKPHHALDLEGLTTLLQAFERSGDVSALGQFLGVYLRSHENHRRMLIFESEGAFYPDRAFPSEGDVPGRDHPLLPRPTGRRTLSVELDHQPVITAYESSAPRTTIQDYGRKLEKDGFSVDALTAPSHSTRSKSDGSRLRPHVAGRWASVRARSLLVRADHGIYWVLPSEGQVVLVRLP